MTLYTEPLKPGEFSNISFYAGREAFYNMGFEMLEVTDFEQLTIKENNLFLAVSALYKKL